MAKRRKDVKMTAMFFLAALLVTVSIFTYYSDCCNPMKLTSYSEVSETIYGAKTNPQILDSSTKYVMASSYVENKVREFAKNNEVDITPPTFEVEYNIITITTDTPSFEDNIIGAVTDDCDANPKLEFIGMIGKKSGIYPIKFVASDEAGNSFTRTVYYLYNLKPGNMKKPFVYSSEYGDVMIVNKKIPLPKGYNKGIKKVAKKQMKKMLAAIKKDGCGTVKIKSGFRSYKTQAKIFARYTRQEGSAEAANRYSARPGYSEHQSGYAYDIGKISKSFAKTKAFTWLQEHAHEYGFIMRYPKDKEEITGYIYEPWHYRYVGVELATEIKESGMTLEEFLKIKP